MSDEMQVTNNMPRFDKKNLPDFKNTRKYQKKLPTRAIRIHGEFSVETSEGVMVCLDGYLALDALGNPYPIEKKVFDKTYQEIPSGLFK